VIALSDISRCYGCGTRNPIGLHLSQHARRVDDDVVIDVSLGPFFAGYPGIAHGGVVATMLDEGRRVHSTAEVTDVAGVVLASAEAVMVVTGDVAEETRLEYLAALGS
jgi:acyl-coenzyme A thioesterase PaaI-like protein